MSALRVLKPKNLKIYVTKTCSDVFYYRGINIFEQALCSLLKKGGIITVKHTIYIYRRAWYNYK